MTFDEVVRDELARLILGGRGPARPELRMDATGHITRIAVAYRFACKDLGSQLIPVLRRAVTHISRALNKEAS